MDQLVQVAILTPLPAVRAGLRSLIHLPGAVEVSYEAPAWPDVAGIPAEIDVLLITAETLVFSQLSRMAQRQEGRLAVLLLTDEAQLAQPLSHMPLRAWGILGLDCSADELETAVRALSLGLWVGSPALLTPALSRQLTSGSLSSEPIPNQFSDPLAEPLTERENEVLQWLARGLANKQIAAALGISEHTVKFHIASIYAKLHTTNRAETVRQGIQQGLILL